LYTNFILYSALFCMDITIYAIPKIIRTLKVTSTIYIYVIKRQALINYCASR